MLVIERDEGEAVTFTIPPGQSFVEETIKIRFFKITRRKTVRMGIEAPERIKISRDETAKTGA
jgi:sRNA-binding carbon storage regulator CsrA